MSFHLVAHSLPQEASNSLIPKNQSSVKSCFLSHRPYIKVLIEYLTVSWQTQEKWQVHNFKFKKKNHHFYDLFLDNEASLKLLFRFYYFGSSCPLQ